MSIPLPPLDIYDKDFARNLTKAYRDAYKACKDGKPHAAGMEAARSAYVLRFPFPNEETAAGVIRAILGAVELKHPGLLSSNSPRRYPNSNEDAAQEVADLGRRWG